MSELPKLNALNPLDGRYLNKTESLQKFFSEYSLMRYRTMVEVEYLIALSDPNCIAEVRQFSEQEIEFLRNIYKKFSLTDARKVKVIETRGFLDKKPTWHDVKAIEYFIKRKLRGTSLQDVSNWVHWALTSEDINNIAYASMLTEAKSEALLPELNNLISQLAKLIEEHKEVSMLSRTHGQPASPTTVGKMFNEFRARLVVQLKKLKQFKISAKLNGATGNYNAHKVMYSNYDWLTFSSNFLQELPGVNGKDPIRLKPEFITTQVGGADSYAELFQIIARINNILLDFTQDMWRYISDDIFVQKKEGVGSSTMPHKINPINFENAEGNLGLANAMFEFFSKKLPISRLQRDLSDSTVKRNFGVAFGYSFVAYKSILKGLKKIKLNEQKFAQQLQAHPEVLAEAVQIVLKAEGIDNAYEQLQEFTQGNKITKESLDEFIQQFDISNASKDKLLTLTPADYIGLAIELTSTDWI